jgi:four helix bundle protein
MQDFKGLDVYRCAIELARLAREIVNNMPRGDSDLGDQFRRAARSIVLNIAEGAGKPSLKDRARYNAIARGSAMECGGIADLLGIDGLASAEQVAKASELAERLTAMLTKMCR